MEYLEIALILLAFGTDRGCALLCYNCTSSEWSISNLCELIVTRGDHPFLHKINCPDKCGSIIYEPPNIVERRCMTEQEKIELEKDSSRVAGVAICAYDKCNEDDPYWILRQDHGELDFKEEHKICCRCTTDVTYDDRLQLTDVSCDNNPTIDFFKGGRDCENRLCTVVYRNKDKYLQRMCYSWKRVQEIMEKTTDDIVVHWCREEQCNCDGIVNYTDCRGGESKTLERDRGCKIIKVSSDKGKDESTASPKGKDEGKGTGDGGGGKGDGGTVTDSTVAVTSGKEVESIISVLLLFFDYLLLFLCHSSYENSLIVKFN